MNLVFLGPPGAGKGTQAENICRDYGVVQLSTGDILRANRQLGTPLGKEAESYMNKGELVPDDIIINMIKTELAKPELRNGCLLDGFPRTVRQAETLDSLLKEMHKKLDVVLVLEVANEILLERLTKRRTCPQCGKTYHLIFNPPQHQDHCDQDDCELYQRKDDSEDAIVNRLLVYDKQTKPLIQYYVSKNLAKMIDGVGNLDEVYGRIKKALDK